MFPYSAFSFLTDATFIVLSEGRKSALLQVLLLVLLLLQLSDARTAD
jgi:hypothetical protein